MLRFPVCSTIHYSRKQDNILRARICWHDRKDKRKNWEKITTKTTYRWERRQRLSREEGLIFKLAMKILVMGYREVSNYRITYPLITYHCTHAVR
jgi:hypothetical protein